MEIISGSKIHHILSNPEFLREIGRLAGLHVSSANVSALQTHVRSRIRARRLVSEQEFLALLGGRRSEDADERRLLATVLTTHETFFMRDASQMALLRSRILPECIAARRASGELVLRLWSCACASGEEPASLAILLRELLPDLAQWRIEIHATDISDEVLSRARLGSYGEWSFRGCEPEFRAAYFGRHGDRWILQPAIRQMIQYHRLDVLQDVLPDPASGLANLDLILCRNLFIYFEPEAIEAATGKLASCLREGGVLMTAHGELRQHRPDSLSAELHPESVIYRKLTLPQHAPADASIQEPAWRSAPLAPPVSLALAPRPPSAQRRRVSDAPTQCAPAHSDDALDAAWRLADAGQLEASQSACDQILANDRMSAGAHFLAAVLATEAGKLAKAQTALRKALYLDPELIAAHVHLERVQLAQTRIESAGKTREAIRRLVAAKPAAAQIPYMGQTTVGDLADLLATNDAPLTARPD